MKKAWDFSTKLTRKVIQMGMRVALSAKVKENGLGVVETLEWPGIKTKDFAKRINELGWNKTLFVTGKEKVPETLEAVASVRPWLSRPMHRHHRVPYTATITPHVLPLLCPRPPGVPYASQSTPMHPTAHLWPRPCPTQHMLPSTP